MDMEQRERGPLTPEATQQLAAIVEASDDAIVGAALDGTITSWSAAAERLYGYSPAERIGQNVRTLIPAERMTGLEERLALIGHGESLLRFETTHVRKDGTPVEVSVSMFPIRDADGTIVGGGAVCRD